MQRERREDRRRSLIDEGENVGKEGDEEEEEKQVEVRLLKLVREATG